MSGRGEGGEGSGRGRRRGCEKGVRRGRLQKGEEREVAERGGGEGGCGKGRRVPEREVLDGCSGQVFSKCFECSAKKWEHFVTDFEKFSKNILTKVWRNVF